MVYFWKFVGTTFDARCASTYASLLYYLQLFLTNPIYSNTLAYCPSFEPGADLDHSSSPRVRKRASCMIPVHTISMALVVDLHPRLLTHYLFAFKVLTYCHYLSWFWIAMVAGKGFAAQTAQDLHVSSARSCWRLVVKHMLHPTQKLMP